jgi:hypothetical protein
MMIQDLDDTAMAYIFTYDGNDWGQTAVLIPPEPAYGNGFGFATAVSGDFVITGAWGHNSGTGRPTSSQLNWETWR